MTKSFIVKVNDDYIKVKKKKGKWKFDMIEKRGEFKHFSQLQDYIKALDNIKIESDGEKPNM